VAAGRAWLRIEFLNRSRHQESFVRDRFKRHIHGYE
jgi:hypothetical protein